jgi:hypothetical protein
MLVKELKSKGSPQLNLVMCRYNALDNDTIIRLYFNDWTLIQNMQGFGKKRHTELKAILNAMKVNRVRK